MGADMEMTRLLCNLGAAACPGSLDDGEERSRDQLALHQLVERSPRTNLDHVRRSDAARFTHTLAVERLGHDRDPNRAHVPPPALTSPNELEAPPEERQPRFER